MVKEKTKLAVTDVFKSMLSADPEWIFFFLIWNETQRFNKKEITINILFATIDIHVWKYVLNFYYKNNNIQLFSYCFAVLLFAFPAFSSRELFIHH